MVIGWVVKERPGWAPGGPWGSGAGGALITGLNPATHGGEEIFGGVELTDKQIRDLYDIRIRIAIKDAQTFMPSLINQPKNIKLAIVDMAFNLGYNNLNKFKNTKDLLVAGKYNDAANEVLNSKWANQVKRRATNIAKLIATA